MRILSNCTHILAGGKVRLDRAKLSQIPCHLGLPNEAEVLHKYVPFVPNLSLAPRRNSPRRPNSPSVITLRFPIIMSENSAPNSSSTSRCDYTAAFLLLRLWLGLRTLMAGVEKFESSGSYSFENYYKNMGRMAQGITSSSFMPLWMTKTFAMSLGYLLIVFGVALLLGLKTRASLFLTGLLYVGLSFGLMAVQEADGVAWLGMHIVMFSGALFLVRYNRFALWADKE